MISDIFNFSFDLGSQTITTFDIILIIAIIVITKIAQIFIWRALDRFFKSRNLEEGRAFAIARFVKYTIFVIAFLLIANALNLSMTGLMLGSAGLLVGIGMGLQQTFSDFISGIILLVEGDIKVGHQLIIDHEIGTIKSIGARTCKVETRDEKEHIIPNSKIVGDHVINLSMNSDKSRFSVNVGVAYSSDPDEVTQVLLNCAQNHKLILPLPKPSVQFSDFGDSSLNFKLQFYTRDYMNIEAIRSDLRYRIFKSLKTNKIEIPFPQRDIWLKNYV